MAMDAASRQAVTMLEALARCSASFVDLSQTLRASPSVTAVVRGFDCRGYQSGTTVEAYADAELANGQSICWWLEITWNEQHWLIHTSVLVNDEHGQRPYKEFADRNPTTLDEFVVQLEDAYSELIKSYNAIDLKEV